MIEELDFLGDEQFESVERSTNKFDFPCVTITESGLAYFNEKISEYFNPKKVRWYVSPNYVVVTHAKDTDLNSFRVNHNCYSGFCTHFPAALFKDKKVAKGAYKLYKCKDGFAFKRYEPLDIKENDDE